MIKKIEGIVTHETAYGESSKIINIFTKNYGIIGVMAKGAKSLRSKLRNFSTPFTYGSFHVYFKEDKLSTLIECEIIDEFSYLKSDLISLSYMTYLVELTTQIYKQNSNQAIYDLLISTLKKMNNKLNPKVLTNILELKLLDYLGVSLKLDSCVHCDSKTNIITINSEEGGFICKKCYHNELIYDEKVIKMMRMYYLIDIDSISSLDISEPVLNSINNFINSYYEQYTGLYLNSKKYLETLINKY